MKKPNEDFGTASPSQNNDFGSASGRSESTDSSSYEIPVEGGDGSEQVETLNKAQALVSATEQTLAELGEEIPAPAREQAEKAIGAVRDALAEGDLSEVKASTESLKKAGVKLAEIAAALTGASAKAKAAGNAAGKAHVSDASGDGSSVDSSVNDDIISEAERVVTEAADTASVQAEELAKAQAEAADWRDKFMRLHAEWDTYRRRTNEQRQQEKARAAENLVSGLLPVLDDFERTIDYATQNGETGLLSGVQAVYSKLVGILQKDGVEIINPEGEAFDALQSQAVATVDDPSVPDETVAQVYQKGYRLGTKVLRPAMVTVTTGGPKRPKEETSKEA